MNAIGGTCLVCQAELRSDTRFCPTCGRPTGNGTSGTAPGGVVKRGAVPDDTLPDDTLPGSPVPGLPWPGSPSPGQEPGDGPGFTVAAPPSPVPPAPAPPAPVSPPAGWGPTVTQPPLPAWPHPAPLPPAPWPQALPSPPQPQPAPSYPPPSYPPPAYQRPDYEQQRPPHPQGFDPFRPRDPAVPSGTGPAEIGPPSMGPPSGPPRQPPRRHDGRRSGSSVALWTVLLVVLVGGGAAGFLIARPFSHPTLSQTASTGTRPATPGGSAASTGASGGGITSPSASSSAPAVTEQQAATSVAAMLSQSVSDRASISSAASDVGTCGPSLNSDPKVFDDAANSRKALLASLTTMPGRAALPPAVISDLAQAWQASIAADQAYARWANDEITQGCVKNDTRDPGYQATVTPNTDATKHKTAFVAGWNPVAARYGLTQYQQGQL
jgi:hypothetical protein